MEYPIIIDSTPVRVRGEALSDIWVQGRQWAVTTYGIERRDGRYYIEAARLGRRFKSNALEVPEWMMYMGTKDWCDIEDFAAIFLAALALHEVPPFTERAIGEARRLMCAHREWSLEGRARSAEERARNGGFRPVMTSGECVALGKDTSNSA